MAKAMINRRLLRWARERCGMSVDALAGKVNTRPNKILSWEAETDRPTFKQAEKLARALHIPFGYLFLDQEPDEELPIPDLRAHAEWPSAQLHSDFLDLIRDVRFKLDWYKYYLSEHGAETIPFVGRYNLNNTAEEIVADMSNTLKINADTRTSTTNWEEHLRNLIRKAEQAGIWVMRNGVVGNNNWRPLSTDVFRGFAISDSIAPLIFINARDAKAAQIFTLAHELAHIWLAESGISDPFQRRTEHTRNDRLEIHCNKIASELLVPANELIREWNHRFSLDENTNRLARHFRVSQIVIAIRARNMYIVGVDAFEEFFDRERARWQTMKTLSSGGDYFKTVPARHGAQFMNAVVTSAMSGELLFRDAAILLNVKPHTVVKFYKILREAR